MAKNLVLRSFAYAVAFTSLFVLTIGAVLIAMVVGDWILGKTGNEILSWFVGVFVMLGYLCTLGGGIGIWLWLRGPTSDAEIKNRNDTMDRILFDMEHGPKD